MRVRPFSICGVLLLAALLGGCDDPPARLPNRANFTAVLNDYLALRGHLCLAKYAWPITVAAGSHDPDAQQMPVLEKLGLVVGKATRITRKDASGATEALPAMEYALSAEGQKHYLHMPIVIRTATRHITYPADLCAATLAPDRLLGWDPPRTRDGRTATSLLFTYRIAPAPWARTPEVLQAFPMLARAIEGEGTTQLRLGVHLTAHGWAADEMDDSPPQ